MVTYQYRHGLVLGKFMPPHRGHDLVIQTAMRRCQSVSLLISCLPADVIAPAQRLTWLRQLYPTTNVRMMPVTWPVTEAEGWANGALAALGGQRPDVVFSSEDYGLVLADLWGAHHVMVDRERSKIPVSSKQILATPERYREYLAPLVRAFFRLR